MTAEPLPPMLVDERQAARLLGVSPRTLFNMRRAGKLACVKIGSRKLYTTTELQQFIARQTEVAND